MNRINKIVGKVSWNHNLKQREIGFKNKLSKKNRFNLEALNIKDFGILGPLDDLYPSEIAELICSFLKFENNINEKNNQAINDRTFMEILKENIPEKIKEALVCYELDKLTIKDLLFHADKVHVLINVLEAIGIIMDNDDSISGIYYDF